jgi:hypothetical protein
MPIQPEDIKLLKAQVNLDTTDGGGAMTADEVVDGLSNNLFADISELDRTYGRVSLRKAFPAVVTTSVDSYYGAHAIISRVPQDPRVSVSLFSTNDWTDRRAAARDKIERYLARGPKWSGHLLEMQLEGQRAIQLSLDAKDDDPKVGQGLSLVQFEGLPTEYEQYVRVQKITSVLRTFQVHGKPVERKITTVEITDPLRFNFEGVTVSEYLDDVKAKAYCRDTRVANAAEYYGASKLTQPAAMNDASITAESIFAQLVPSATSETPMLDLNGASLNGLIRPGNADTITYQVGIAFGPTTNVYIGSAIIPGTLTLTAGGYTVKDVAGVLKINANIVGEIEYDKGLLRFNAAAPVYNGTGLFVFKPGAKPVQVADTASISIVQDIRGYNYTITLLPIPSPGTLSVSYMSQGKVYYLFERGNGALTGSDAAFGTGSINFTTGSVLVTTGALPDADSELIFAWGRTTTTFARNDTVVEPAKIRLVLSKEQVAPGSLTLSWTLNSIVRSATDDGNGNLTGDATGKVNYSSGVVMLQVSSLLQKGAQITADYQWGNPNEFTVATATANGAGDYVIQLPNQGGAVVPKSVEIGFDVHISKAGGEFTEVETLPKWAPSFQMQGLALATRA